MPVTSAEDDLCYGPGSIVLTVFLTIIVTLLLLYILYVIWKRWKQKKDKHLVLETDPEKGKNSYAFDNDGYTDAATPYDPNFDKSSKLDSTKSKWSQWSPITALLTRNEKQKTVDDSVLQVGEMKTVSLKSHDFTGLGFNIYGNMREGIFIKDILHRGPASESGKLNPGDRVKSVTINFDHVVYEDALTILSYASPYEVIIEAQSGKMNAIHSPTKSVHLGHPLYRSSSTTDLIWIQKTAKKRLFLPDEANHSRTSSPHSSLQKTRSTATTLERKASHSPKASPHNTSTTSQNLRTQLEQKIVQNHKQQLKTKEETMPDVINTDLPKAENKYQKFGIKVLPVVLPTDTQQVSPKINELSQNDNNINLEIHSDKILAMEQKLDIDEVDKVPPPVKKREKNNKTAEVTTVQEDEIDTVCTFVRQDSVNGSGIRRDENGIPQEIPNHMLNAAVAARRNRKSSDEIIVSDDVKSPKKPKGRAPAPPDNKANGSLEVPNECYASDSDLETDNQSSVNTIELNPNDITIHQSEEIEDIQNRKTASTGDLTKIHKNRKVSTGTLERAQSLDITDTGIPSLNKKLDSQSGSEDSLYGKILAEPRLSLALDGLNTFQRSRLKKSTDWGNLEDAILNLDKSDGDNIHQFNSLEQSPHFEALVNKINEIKQESHVVDVAEEEIAKSQDDAVIPEESERYKNLWSIVKEDIDLPVLTSNTSITLDKSQLNNHIVIAPVVCEKQLDEATVETVENHIVIAPQKQTQADAVHHLIDVNDFLVAERSTATSDPYYGPVNKIYDTNVSDDIKVSRHSFGSLSDSNANISNITINSNSVIPNSDSLLDDEFYVTASDKTLVHDNFTNEETPASNADVTLTEVGNVTIEGPTSLTVQINETPLTNTGNTITITPDHTPKSNYSLTYITEIQVLTPNDDTVDTSPQPSHTTSTISSSKTTPINDKLDVEKELHKIQEIAEEQLKKLPEMRFSTSSYESPKAPENYSSQIEQLRSNFEKSPSKTSLKLDTTGGGVSKSRIPVATTKTPPTSPERRDSRNFDLEIDKDIVAIMSSPIHSTPISNLKYQPKVSNKNVSVTSIRSNSKIPSGLPSRPPIPPRKYDLSDGDSLSRISTNGGSNNSTFKQWVFNPGDNTVTNITVSESKFERK